MTGQKWEKKKGEEDDMQKCSSAGFLNPRWCGEIVRTSDSVAGRMPCEQLFSCLMSDLRVTF